MNGDWQTRAACLHPSVAPTDFTPPRDGRNQPDLAAAADTAHRICRRCPVRPECRQHAEQIGAQDVVMGGYWWPSRPYQTKTAKPLDLLADPTKDAAA